MADDRGPIHQDFQLSVGAFSTDFDTKLRVDGSAGTGTVIDWEREFGYLGDHQERFRIDAAWRFAKRHKLRAMYFENNRSGTQVLTREIRFGDDTFPVNLQVDTGLDFLIVELAYEYTFLKRENLEVGGSFGIHDLVLSGRVSGALGMSGGAPAAELDETESLNGPLPVIGMHVLWEIGANCYVEGLGQVFAVEFGEYKGTLSDVKIGVTWFPWRNLGIGVAYNRFVGRVDIDDDYNSRITLRYGGPLAYFAFGF